MSRTSHELLTEALVHLELALSHADGDMSQQVVLDGVALRLSAGIETLGRLDEEVRDQLFGEDWSLMWGM